MEETGRKLLEAGLSETEVSYNGESSLENNAIHTNGDFEKNSQNPLKLHELSKKLIL